MVTNLQTNVLEEQDTLPGDTPLGTEPLWTVKEVAGYLRLGQETVRMMARRGELPSLKVGKRVWRFKPGDVKGWLSTHQG